jgi:hypothetical protein
MDLSKIINIKKRLLMHRRSSEVVPDLSLPPCIALRVVGGVVFLRHWRKICTILQLV